jgi:hypothetical protein
MYTFSPVSCRGKLGEIINVDLNPCKQQQNCQIFLDYLPERSIGCSYHFFYLAQFQRNSRGRLNIWLLGLHTVYVSYLQAYAIDYNKVDTFQKAVEGRRERGGNAVL